VLYLIAILLPPLALLLVGKPIQALVSLLLMLTLIGWIPAAVWAILVVKQHHDRQNADRIIEAVRGR
jgi:uncharacterized membrane protein YqaE (UPF0057 family)